MEKSKSPEKNSAILPFTTRHHDNFLVPDSYFDALVPNRKERVEQYLSSFDMVHRDATNILAKDFQDEARPLASTTVLIPVAAHQEAPTIANAVKQYANQKTNSPFSVLMYLNAPFDAPNDAVAATLEEVKKAKNAHPELDLRVSEVERFIDETTIGEIRRSLWDAAVLLSHYEGLFDDPSADVIGINNDIDVHALSPRYIQHIQNHAQHVQARYEHVNLPSRPMEPMSTMVKHATDPARPNLSKVVFWHDFAHRQLRDKSRFEAGIVVPFSHYVTKGGFQPKSKTHETQPLIGGSTPQMIPRTILETSPRRFIDRLQTNSLKEIWTDESFGASDQCRTQTDTEDITDRRKEEIISDSFNTTMPYFFYHTANNFLNEAYSYRGELMRIPNQTDVRNLSEKLRANKRLALYALDRVVQSPLLAKIVDVSYDTDIMTRQLALGEVPPVL